MRIRSRTIALEAGDGQDPGQATQVSQGHRLEACCQDIFDLDQDDVMRGPASNTRVD